MSREPPGLAFRRPEAWLALQVKVALMLDRKEVAIQILSRIAEVWQAEADRIRWVAPDSTEFPGFDWWPGDFCVRVRAAPAPEGAEFNGSKVSVRTDFLRDVAIDTELFESMTANLSFSFTSTYSWVYPPQSLWTQFRSSGASPTLWFSSSAYIDAENRGWMTELIASTSIIQPINAQTQAKTMAKLLGSGVPDTTKRYSSSAGGLDEILEVVAQVYAPLGQQTSRFANTAEFEDFASNYGQSDLCFGFGDQTGMSLETPFGNDSALIRFSTDAEHPQLGHGLLITLELPYVDEKLFIAREAADLNLMESLQWTGFPQLGCWHTAETLKVQEGLAFTLFMPNALY